MVDVGEKPVTRRRARAICRLRMKPEILAQILPSDDGEGVARATGDAPSAFGKGDVLGVARVAGIQASKDTSRLIPLCHPLGLDQVGIEFELSSEDTLLVAAEVRLSARTGPEMEALVAVTVAALTVYDMCKAVDPDMVIEEARLDEKEGGKKGLYRHPRSR